MKIHGILGYVNTDTYDGRSMLDVVFRKTPMALLSVLHKEKQEGHYGSFIVGRIDDIWRLEDTIYANGTVFGQDFIDTLKNEQAYFEIDVDDVVDVDTSDPHKMVMGSARVMACTIGRRPVWDGLEVHEEWLGLDKTT